jgi:hypothetical protein
MQIAWFTAYGYENKLSLWLQVDPAVEGGEVQKLPSRINDGEQPLQSLSASRTRFSAEEVLAVEQQQEKQPQQR